MNFGNIQIVDKTFTRKVNNPKGQAYEGIKFRRWVSKKGEQEGQLKETFTFSDKLFAKLSLDNYALTQANTPEAVLLLVVEDQDDVKPFAKFMRQSFEKETGIKQAKGKMFNNTFLLEELVNMKVLDGKTQENQYLTLEDVSEAALPFLHKAYPGSESIIKSVHIIKVDDTVNEEEEEVGAGVAEAPVASAAAPKDDF